MSKKIEKEIDNLLLTKKKASDYIYNDRYLDFCEEIDENILKLRKKLITELFKNQNRPVNKFQISCFKRIDGYLIEEFIRNKSHTIEEFDKILAEVETEYIDNYITLWYTIKPISLNDWLDKFKLSLAASSRPVGAAAYKQTALECCSRAVCFKSC